MSDADRERAGELREQAQALEDEEAALAMYREVLAFNPAVVVRH